jgi:hypothetical protein
MTTYRFKEDQLDVIISSMINGIHGSFARALGEAYILADSNNKKIIVSSFGALLARVAAFLDIEIFDEAEFEIFLEKRMNVLDKKLMQGHIDQEEYERRVNELKEVKYETV